MWNPFRRKLVLAVCTGNTCRSPMVAALLRRQLSRWRYRVESAGTCADNGRPISENSALALREIGVNASSHKSRKLTREMAKNASFIFAIGKGNAYRIKDEHCIENGKVICLDIPDPFRQSLAVYRETLKSITNCLSLSLPLPLPLPHSDKP